MEIYCTICCKTKKTNKEPIEAKTRYISKRINDVYNKSKKNNIKFRILSGKFGLLEAKEKIPFYDYRLDMKKTQNLSRIIEPQLSSQKINKVIFFSEDPINKPNWKPYIKVIKTSCSKLNISLEIKYIKQDSK